MNKALSESHIPFEINWSLYLSVVIVKAKKWLNSGNTKGRNKLI
jgi:hypothetical protein